MDSRTVSQPLATRTRPMRDPAYQALVLLRSAFMLAPIVFGLDKFVNVLTDWERYLAPAINDVVPGSADQAMLMVGVVEIAAGVLVAVRPRIGGYVVAGWLAGIIFNLLLIPGFYDIALRDFGLLVAAVALARLAAAVRPGFTATAGWAQEVPTRKAASR